MLLELSPNDADRLQLLGEAAGLLGAAPPGTYPAQVHWRQACMRLLGEPVLAAPPNCRGVLT